MTLHNIFIIIIALIAPKFLFLFAVFILKIKYKLKAKGNEDKEVCSINRTTYLDWGTEYDQWYIIPCISFYINNGFGISICWLKLCYNEDYDIITIEEVKAKAKARYNLIHNNNESSSV